jgi:hypothetical protein
MPICKTAVLYRLEFRYVIEIARVARFFNRDLYRLEMDRIERFSPRKSGAAQLGVAIEQLYQQSP